MTGQDVMKREISWWQVIALVILIIGVILTIWSAQQQDQSMRNDLLIKTSIARTGVSIGQLQALNGSTADLSSSGYQALKAQLQKIRQTDPSIRFAYLMGQRPDGGIFIYADSEPADSPDYSPPGQDYPEVSAIFQKAFSEKAELTEGPSSDRWGTFVSAIVPITDQETGQLIAFFGLDVEAKNWYSAIAQASVDIITVTLLILVLVIAFGLTQRRNQREERRLAASEAKFSRAFHLNPALMVVSSIKEGRFLDVNSSFVVALGYSPEEVIGKTPSDLGLYSDPAQWEVIQNQFKDAGQVRDLDVKIVRKDHAVLDVLFSAIPIEVTGTPCMLSVILDITGRKQAEEALYMSLVMDGVPTRLSYVDADLNFVYTNNAYADRFGRTREDLAGKSIRDVYGEEVFLQDLRHYQGVLSGKTISFESNTRDTEGFEHFEIITLVPHYSGELVTGFFVSVMDITERKRAGDALTRVNQKLNVLSQLTQKDLTSQIFVLSGYLELVKKHAAGQDYIIETLQKGDQVIRRIRETVEYSKDYQDMGAKPPKWQNVKMAMLFGLSHISIGEIQHSIETENLEIFADPLLEMVCMRLFANSVEHGAHITRTRVWHMITPLAATIYFEDDGIGIPQEKKEQIFLRSDSSRTSMRSLIFIREILDITNITIRETGEPGKGARFEMVVPNGAWRIGGL